MIKALVCSMFVIPCAFAGGEGWSTDFDAALRQAADEEKNLLIDFTGSDWCGPCIKLNKDVFSQDAFQKGVEETLVLVEIDLPRKTKLPAEVAAQNDALREKYGIKGYPTVLLTDETGRPFARTGSQPVGPEKYVEHLNELMTLRAKRDAAFAEAEKAEGLEKAKALVTGLRSIALDDEMVARFYADEIVAIKAADPSDESGYFKGLVEKGKIAGLVKELNSLGAKKDFEGAIKLSDEALASGDFQEMYRIQIAMFKATFNMQAGKKEEALKALDEATAINPESPFVPRIEVIRKRIEETPVPEEKPQETPEEAPKAD